MREEGIILLEETQLDGLRSFGVIPLKNCSIMVQFTTTILHRFLANLPFRKKTCYVLQICQNELLLLPLKQSGEIKGKDIIKIKTSTIRRLTIETDDYSYYINITCVYGSIQLITSTKELVKLKTRGSSPENHYWGTKNWHQKNFSHTIEQLEHLI